MNLRRYARITVDGTWHRVVVRRCHVCRDGTHVWVPDGFRSRARYLGHVRVGPHRRMGLAAMVSAAGCPGDVSVSTRWGYILWRETRMHAVVAGLRSLVSNAV